MFRARGDGPPDEAAGLGARPCSPRTRGWSPEAHDASPASGMFPAHAGMVLTRGKLCCTAAHVPRARGDGPNWTEAERVTSSMFPAHAGMVLASRRFLITAGYVPRARGDGPIARRAATRIQNMFPAHAGMVPGPVGCGPDPSQCSPRTRGWSSAAVEHLDLALMFPAHAGMVRRAGCRWMRRCQVPRARGDGPWRCVVLLLTLHVPRARGDGPSAHLPDRADLEGSRARGDGPDRRAVDAAGPECSPRGDGPCSGRALRMMMGRFPGTRDVRSPSRSRLRGRHIPRARRDGPTSPPPTGLVQ